MKKAKLLARIVFMMSMFYALPALAQSESTDANLAEPNAQEVKVVYMNIARVPAAARCRSLDSILVLKGDKKWCLKII